MRQEHKIKHILSRAGVRITNKEFKQYLKAFNNYERPISHTVYEIIQSPKAFIDFVRQDIDRHNELLQSYAENKLDNPE